MDDGAGATITTMDWLGRTIRYRDAAGTSTFTTYDRAGRVSTQSGTVGTVRTTYGSGSTDAGGPAEPLPEFLTDDEDEAGDTNDDEHPHAIAAE